MDREDSIPTGRWADPGAATAGKGEGRRVGGPGLGASMKLKRLTGESGWQNSTTGWLADPDR
jgi:hypothetical protein